MSAADADTVLFIPGLWIHSDSWAPWAALYEKAGYTAIVEGWPGQAATPAETRRNPAPLDGVGLEAITEHYARLILQLPAVPVVIGHSFGGVVAQKLLARGLASRAVAVDPGPIKGVTKLPFAQIRSALPVVKSKKNRSTTVALTRKQFRFGFGNALPKSESDALFSRWAIPGPGRPLFEATEAKKTDKSPAQIDTRLADRGPLLIIGGGKDHTVPEVVTRQEFELYDTPAITDYKVFADRGHSLVFDSNWKQIADYTLSWVAAHRVNA
ncbi:alpha/beta hydrolase [Herbiconiux daphne]|uniref:Alpha/beta hydrolase n=1 Tax=Herbiconiux daphne TaxID=2970914 RepID=A0ABT2H5A3_9MICO|nr:alpha/beta hydrolase [Herbiconiux daphne]MCS5735122.1 alpha/beta hydrolase [Herbiconiux daphne]